MGSQEPVHLMIREAADICHLVGVKAPPVMTMQLFRAWSTLHGVADVSCELGARYLSAGSHQTGADKPDQ